MNYKIALHEHENLTILKSVTRSITLFFRNQSALIAMRILLIIISLAVGWLSVTHSTEMEYVTIGGDCNFGRPSFPRRNEMMAYTMIPESSSMNNTKFCRVWYNSSKGILRLWLQKTSKRAKVSLVGTVLDEQGVLVLPGYVTEAEEHVAYPFHICPSLDKSSNRNYSIFLSATPLTGQDYFPSAVVFLLLELCRF